MVLKKYVARVDNIYFLSPVGMSLQWATKDIAERELPADVRYLLRRLEQLEAQALTQKLHADNDPAA